MKIGVLKEDQAKENRVSIVPNVASKLIDKGFEVFVEDGCGSLAGFSNGDYEESKCNVVLRDEIFQCDIIIKINAPSIQEANNIKEKSILICHMDSFNNHDVIKLLNEKFIQVYALELIPRISRAQSMDILSSQSNLIGYYSVIKAASVANRVLPMMMTSAGSIAPIKAFIMGVGVAGLQAIATAKRLGCIVSAYDIREETKEQVQSLGAKFLDLNSQNEDSKDKVLADHISKQDIIITTAMVMGKKAPVLINNDLFSYVKYGSTIIDLASSSGGNCIFSEYGKLVEKNGVKIVGYNLINDLSHDASKLFANNVFNFLNPHIKNNVLDIDYEDEIIKNTLISYNGQIVNNIFR